MNQPKIILPNKPKTTIDPNNVVVTPSAEHLLSDGFNIIANELARMRQKVSSGRGLDNNEARVFQGYMKCLTDISKEMRERDKQAEGADLSELSLDELKQLVAVLEEQATKANKGKGEAT